MEYAEIATVLNCSELRSRVMFFRAKTSLRRHFAVQGFSKHYLLIALALFGLVTTSAKAASSATITASSLEVGVAAVLVAILSSKVGLAATAGVTALAFALPLQTFLYILGFGCLAVLCVVLVGLFGVYNS